MNPQEHTAFTQTLTETLKVNPEVLGLILLGSTAGTHHQPDGHSDHDFFLIVPEALTEAYRNTVDWLPPCPVPIVHHFRDTPHGARVIYEGGHLLEYAVFTPDEIALSRNHHTRVAFDRVGDLEQRLKPTLDTSAPNVPALLSDFYLHLLVGVGRHTRGETLAGRQMLNFAMQDTLALLHALVPPQQPEMVDSRNPWRHVEQTHPALAKAIAGTLQVDTPQAAQTLLNLVRDFAGPHWDEKTAQAVQERIRAAS